MFESFSYAHIRLPKQIGNTLTLDVNGGLTLAYDIVLNDTLDDSFLVISKAFCSTEDRYTRARGRTIASGRLLGLYHKVRSRSGTINYQNLGEYVGADITDPTVIPLTFFRNWEEGRKDLEMSDITHSFDQFGLHGYVKESAFPLREIVIHSFGCVLLAHQVGFNLEEAEVIRAGKVNLLLPFHVNMEA